MPSRPRFSILMPTRNRARLLQLSLQSALGLRGDDYEVVVSDNCSTDETREVVASLADPRVRYVRTPKPVAVSENMEFVLGRARGEFVTFLCDDDALAPGMLESARGILDATSAQLLVWPISSYFYTDWYDIRYRNTLVVRPYSGRIEEVQARHTLAGLFRDIEPGRMPFLMNSVCQRTLIESAQRRVPRLCPALLLSEVFAGVVLLAEAGTYWWVDMPFTVFGRWPRSVGSSLVTRRWSAGPAYMQEFPAEATFQSVPFKTATPTNLYADAFLRAKAALGDELSGIELDWERYFVQCFVDLMNQRIQGTDVAEDLGALQAALALQPDTVRQAAAAAIRKLEWEHRRSWRRAARRSVNQIPLLGWLENALRPTPRGEPGGLVMRGDQAGFRNILECVRVLDRVLSERHEASHPVTIAQSRG